ncbi:MAG: ASCH domain-containing protein [Gammaproteobacteria bacterium]|nr:ASCH domain-containing protein [Gammaproteobacteria bacterium]
MQCKAFRLPPLAEKKRGGKVTNFKDLPRRALAIRQPWAWAIINADKDVENRTWKTTRLGAFCIHASLKSTDLEWQGCMDILDGIHGNFTQSEMVSRQGRVASASHSNEAMRGGIIGVAEIVGCVDHSASPWFSGPYGFVLQNVRAVPFIPVRGALGFFDWRRNIIGLPAESGGGAGK